MSADINAIIVMESLGLLSFFVAFLFFRQRQRINDKKRAFINALNKRLISERGDGKCFSSEWVLDNVVYRRRKLFSATPLLATAFFFFMVIFYFFIGPRILYNLITFGYASIVALVGISVLLWTDAFQAYNYTDAITQVSTEKLDKEDQSYIELAGESVGKAFLRFLALGIAFAVLGPFIPQIFGEVVYLVVYYSAIYFQASEASFKSLSFLGGVITLILLGLMFVLPVILWQILFHKGKSLTRRMFKRRVKQ